MAQNPVGWFEIYVDDMERAKAFYQSVFDLTLDPLQDPIGSGVEMWAFPADMEQYGASGALVKMEGVAAGGTGTRVYFASDDCAIEESRVEAAGGRVESAKMAIGMHGFISIIIDTEGNMFGLHSQN